MGSHEMAKYQERAKPLGYVHSPECTATKWRNISASGEFPSIENDNFGASPCKGVIHQQRKAPPIPPPKSKPMTDKQWIIRWHDHVKTIVPPMPPNNGVSKEETPLLHEKSKGQSTLEFPQPKTPKDLDKK